MLKNHEKNFSVSARIFDIVPHRPSSSFHKITSPLAIVPRPTNSVYIIYIEFVGRSGRSTLMVPFPSGKRTFAIVPLSCPIVPDRPFFISEQVIKILEGPGFWPRT